MHRLGVTLVELTLVIALIMLLVGLSAGFYGRFAGQNAVGATSEKLAESLKKAQSYAIAGRGNSNWGVQLVGNNFVIYRGNSYVARDTAYDEMVSVEPNVSVSGFAEVNFSRLRGTASIGGVVPTSTPTVTSTPTLTPTPGGTNRSMRFYGHGTSDSDRVKIRIDAPENKVDIGATSFTIEWWMKATNADNVPNTSCSEWICGNIIFDRDIFGDQPRKFGVSLHNGRIRWGSGSPILTVQSSLNTYSNNQWIHVAVTRNVTTGQQCIFRNGSLDVCGSTAAGNISYPNGYTDPSWVNNPFLVFAAEKHDYDPPNYPSYDGFLDEVRISNIVRYTSSYTVPSGEMAIDVSTIAMYRFNEGSGTVLVDAAPSPVNGEVKFGGSPLPSGPIWSTDVPFVSGPTPTPGLTATPTPPTSSPTPVLGSLLTITVSGLGGSRTVSINSQGVVAK